ncbi:hypothetical protein LEMLEM_LOCUS23510 [Lemmus lemmus]
MTDGCLLALTLTLFQSCLICLLSQEPFPLAVCQQLPSFSTPYEKLEKLGEGPYAAVHKGKSNLEKLPVPCAAQMLDLIEPQPSEKFRRMKNFVREFQQHG